MLQPQKEFQSQHILYCAPENPTTMQKSPGNYPVLFLLLTEKLIWLFVCLFVFCCCWLFMWWKSHGPRHLKLGLYCYRKLWERSWKYPLLGNGRPLKPRPGCALLSGVLKMCWNQAWEIRAGRLSQEDLGGQCGRQHPSPSIAFRHSLGAAVL